MRSEFEKWFKTSRSYLILKEANYFNLDLFEFNESYKRYVHNGIQIAFEAYQHQQSKVDELTKQRDSFIKAYEIEINKNIELQKRMDAVKQLIEDYKDPSITSDKSFQHGLLLVVRELEQALKGGES